MHKSLANSLEVMPENIPKIPVVIMDGHRWYMLGKNELEDAEKCIYRVFDMKKYRSMRIWDGKGGEEKMSLDERINEYNAALIKDGINDHGWGHVWNGVTLPHVALLSSLKEYAGEDLIFQHRRMVNAVLSVPAHDIGYIHGVNRPVPAGGIKKDKYNDHAALGALEYGRVMTYLAEHDREAVAGLFRSDRYIHIPFRSEIKDSVQGILHHNMNSGLSDRYFFSYKSKVLALQLMDKLDYFCGLRVPKDVLDETKKIDDFFSNFAPADVLHRKAPLPFAEKIIYISHDAGKIRVMFDIDLDRVTDLGREKDKNYKYTPDNFFAELKVIFGKKFRELETIARCMVGEEAQYEFPEKVKEHEPYLEYEFRFRNAPSVTKTCRDFAEIK